MLDALRRGSVIAARYPADLAAARSLATSSPPIRAIRADSRRAAETAIHLAWINLANNGCGSSGGHLYSTPRPIVWKRTVTDYGTFDGAIAWIKFAVTYAAGRGWKAELNAC